MGVKLLPIVCCDLCGCRLAEQCQPRTLRPLRLDLALEPHRKYILLTHEGCAFVTRWRVRVDEDTGADAAEVA